ncbi:MAG: hypothetical protein WDN48_14215 [Pseudolabrys sp.]
MLQDNDDPGCKHAQKVAQNLTGIVAEVRIVALPGLAEKGDVSDWLEAGGTKKQLVELCAAAPLHAAEPLDPTDPMRTARALMAVTFTDADGLRTLHRHRVHSGHGLAATTNWLMTKRYVPPSGPSWKNLGGS